MTVLLDANVLIALLVDDHVHHGAAENWFVGMSGNFATCPITQGSLATFDQAVAKLYHDEAELVPDAMRGNS